MHLWLMQPPEPDGTDRPTVLFVDTTSDQCPVLLPRTGHNWTERP